ncbi:hypothetical protein CIHG_07946 [Coccidioides immitis H538.4]|uniref:Uncharacterized protein n=3 Tax=Coccidioides immitis TaxID=5501 RepID=A0A0J8RA64_COCIT|nr:hypothetical protein CIRG_10156 [Coccidioides immitis RMSCC 2394]KMU81315.1 hypothetical protein CISG_08726 [Coccidioides immitis RMSCC 3703]KMU90136.1 hypothetical protein CIHG_07946 [Coccidioides immitis H538.4]
MSSASKTIGGVDVNGKTPTKSRAVPVAAAMVTSGDHISGSTPDERKHITLRLGSASDWSKDPRETCACVHVYYKEDKVENGYESYLLKNTRKSKNNSKYIKDKVQAALDNPL